MSGRWMRSGPFCSLLVACLGCGAEATPDGADGAEARSSAPRGGFDEARSHFVIEGNESAKDHPRVSVHIDPGTGEGFFSDGIRRYEIRMLPKPLEKGVLTVWITGLREDTSLGRVEVTDAYDTPSIMVGVGRGLLKGYMKVQSGHLMLEKINGEISLTFEAELTSRSLLDRERDGKQVRVRGRVVDAMIP